MYIWLLFWQACHSRIYSLLGFSYLKVFCLFVFNAHYFLFSLPLKNTN